MTGPGAAFSGLENEINNSIAAIAASRDCCCGTWEPAAPAAIAQPGAAAP